MIEWSEDLPTEPSNWKAQVSALAVGDVMRLSIPKIMRVMELNPKQFVWSHPGLLKRVAEDNGHRLLSVIYRNPKGITLGVLTNRFRDYNQKVVKELAAKLEASGHIRSVSSINKYNKRHTVTYYPSSVPS
jgi:hypothetical protein